jgi:FkbM family methyltransferase
MTLEEDKNQTEEDEFDKIFKDLFNEDKDKNNTSKSKVSPEDDLLDDFFEEELDELQIDDNDNTKISLTTPPEDNKPEDFQWLEDLIKDLDTKDNKEEKANLPAPPAPPGKKSFVSKIADRPKAPPPPKHVAEYGSGKKIVTFHKEEEEPAKKRKISFKFMQKYWKKFAITTGALGLIVMSFFLIKKGLTNNSTEDHIILTKVYSGDKILVDRSLASKSGLEAIKKGYLDSQISNLMYQLIKPGDKVLDVGAGFGYYSLYLARLVGSQGKVYSFEAREKVFNLLEASIAINKFDQITPVQALLFSDKIKVLVNESDENHKSKFGMINIETNSNSDYINSQGSFLVETSTLDDLLGPIPIDFIHVNAQGTEMNILLGAKKILTASPKVKIITSWSKYSMSRYVNLQSMVEQLLANDFKFWLIKPSNGTLIPLTNLDQVMQVERGRILIAKTLN